MINNTIIELSNNKKYYLIDILVSKEKKYFLLTKLNQDETEIDNEFDLCIYNEQENKFELIEDEFEYNHIKNIFENRLNNQKKELETESEIIKLKLIKIDNYDHTFIDDNDKIFTLNIEIFEDFKLQINDYIYISKNTIEENIPLNFGKIYNDKTEIIKIVRGEEQFYLQRYYG